MPLPPRIWSLACFPLPTILDKPMLCVHYPLLRPSGLMLQSIPVCELLDCDHSYVTIDFERASFSKIGLEHAHTYIRNHNHNSLNRYLWTII